MIDQHKIALFEKIIEELNDPFIDLISDPSFFPAYHPLVENQRIDLDREYLWSHENDGKAALASISFRSIRESYFDIWVHARRPAENTFLGSNFGLCMKKVRYTKKCVGIIREEFEKAIVHIRRLMPIYLAEIDKFPSEYARRKSPYFVYHPSGLILMRITTSERGREIPPYKRSLLEF